MSNDKPAPLSYAPPARRRRSPWLYVTVAILILPLTCAFAMAGYMVLNHLTGFSITD